MVVKSEKNKNKAKKAAQAAPAPSAPRKGPFAGVTEEAVERKTFIQNLPVPINPAQRDAVAVELVGVLKLIDDVQAEKHNKNGEFNAKLKELGEKKDELAEAHRTSARLQAVECVELLERTGEVLTVRKDTGIVIDRRQPTSEDLQETIPGTDGSGQREEDEDDGSEEEDGDGADGNPSGNVT